MEKIISREVYSSPFNFKPKFTPPQEEVNGETEATEEKIIFAQPPSFDMEEPEFDENDSFKEDYVDEEDEEQEETEDQSESIEEPESELDEEAVAGSLFEAFKSLGFIADENEVPKATTVSDFLVNYERTKAAKLEEAARKNLEEKYSPEVLSYVDFLMQGGNPEAVSSFYQLYNLPIEDESKDSDNRRALILAMYKDQGLAEKRATLLYNKAYDDDEDLDEAKAAKQYFKAKHDAQLAQIQAEEQAKLDAEAKRNEQLQNELKGMLKSRKVPGLDLSEKEAKEIENYMFNPTVIVDVKDPVSGNVYKNKVSQYYEDYQKFFEQPDALIKLAKFIRAGGQSKTEEEEIQERISQNILRGLNGFNGQRPKKSSGTKRKNAFIN